MEDFELAWGKVKELLRAKMAPEAFNHWISGIVPLKVNDNVCYLGISSDFFAEWLATTYLPWIIESLEEVLKIEGIKVEFVEGFEREEVLEKDVAVVSKPEKKVAKAPKAVKSSASLDYSTVDSLGHRSALNPHYVFDTFVIGDSNKFCHAACTAVAKAPGTHYNPLFIHGGVGLGKTHIAQAVAHEVMKNNPKAKVECLSSEEFLNVYVDAMSNRKEAKFRSHFRSLDLLVIDDVQFFKGKERFQEEFFHTFNTLFNNHKQIVLTSDKPPHELDGLEGRLVSRFEWGVAAEVHVPDLETRAAILKQKQENYKIKVPNEVIFYIAERIKANVRRLEGALSKLVSFASLTKEPITRDLADKLLGSVFEEEVSTEVTVEKIIKLTAEHYDMRVSDITGKKRLANIVRPRQVAMFLSRKLTSLSTPEIGDCFGRNHATILHAVQKVEKEINKDEQFRLTVSKIERQLKSGC
ncbi:MAG: chromosomal replication initiator protein DnaA [Lentisphaeria bacterium]